MKILKLYMLGFGLVVANIAFSQDPIQWKFAAKKITDTKFEVQLTAHINQGWHLYSQKQPEGAIALPTVIQFQKNPLIHLKGVVNELGKLNKVKEPTLGIEAWQFADKVSFVQVIQVKTSVKTKLSGSVEFQACTDEKCLPPKTIEFSIALDL